MTLKLSFHTYTHTPIYRSISINLYLSIDLHTYTYTYTYMYTKLQASLFGCLLILSWGREAKNSHSHLTVIRSRSSLLSCPIPFLWYGADWQIVALNSPSPSIYLQPLLSENDFLALQSVRSTATQLTHPPLLPICASAIGGHPYQNPGTNSCPVSY